MNKELENRLLELIERAIDDQLSQIEIEELESLVCNDAECAKLYATLTQQHALMHMVSPHIGKRLVVSNVAKYSVVPVFQKVWWAAALLFVAFGTWLATVFFDHQQNEFESDVVIAEIVDTAYATWGVCTLPTAKGEKLKAGQLELIEGLATLKFSSGVEMVLEGPVDIELLDSMKAILNAGIVVTDVPERAKGFVIQTPTAKLSITAPNF